MKKITFILLALITGTAFGQTATANAAADIVSPLEIVAGDALNFGKVSNNTAGIVVVGVDGSVAASTLPQIGVTAPSAATFSVTAADGFKYVITLPDAPVELQSGTDIIEIDTFVHDAPADVTGTGLVQTISVGATLNVAANQATGKYTGTFDVSVAYE